MRPAGGGAASQGTKSRAHPLTLSRGPHGPAPTFTKCTNQVQLHRLKPRGSEPAKALHSFSRSPPHGGATLDLDADAAHSQVFTHEFFCFNWFNLQEWQPRPLMQLQTNCALGFLSSQHYVPKKNAPGCCEYSKSHIIHSQEWMRWDRIGSWRVNLS